MITAASAYDICASALEGALKARQEALKAGDVEGQREAEELICKARRALAEWRACEALRCEIAPSASVPGRFTLRHRGRFVAHAPSLAEAQKRACEEGFRVLDVTKCGYFA
jgi:hypothetical protein